MVEVPSSFPDFNLKSLLQTVFEPEEGLRIAMLIDLPDPKEMKEFAFLNEERNTIQKNALDYFYKPLKEHVMAELGLKGGEIYAYKVTGGSNLELPEICYNENGDELNLKDAVYSKYDLILCVSTFSATAPLTAFCKEYGFRGATLHGLNDVILSSGLCVDYEQVSAEAEKMRLAMTKADAVEIDFVVENEKHTLRLELSNQEAQKSHGLCRGTAPDVANLPAGEVYFVPTGASGKFPLQFEDGTIALLDVADCSVSGATKVRGSQDTIDAFP